MRIIPIARDDLPEPTAPLTAACTADACRSGRRDCPTPDACHLSKEEAAQRFSTAALSAGLLAALLGTIVLAGTRSLPGDRVIAEAAIVCSAGASR